MGSPRVPRVALAMVIRHKAAGFALTGYFEIFALASEKTMRVVVTCLVLALECAVMLFSGDAAELLLRMEE